MNHEAIDLEAIKNALDELANVSPNTAPIARSLIRDVFDPRNLRKGLTKDALDHNLLLWETGHVVNPVSDHVRKAIEVLRKVVLY